MKTESFTVFNISHPVKKVNHYAVPALQWLNRIQSLRRGLFYFLDDFFEYGRMIFGNVRQNFSVQKNVLPF